MLKILLKLERKLEEVSNPQCFWCPWSRGIVPCPEKKKKECYQKYCLRRDKYLTNIFGGVR